MLSTRIFSFWSVSVLLTRYQRPRQVPSISRTSGAWMISLTCSDSILSMPAISDLIDLIALEEIAVVSERGARGEGEVADEGLQALAVVLLDAEVLLQELAELVEIDALGGGGGARGLFQFGHGSALRLVVHRLSGDLGEQRLVAE